MRDFRAPGKREETSGRKKTGFVQRIKKLNTIELLNSNNESIIEILAIMAIKKAITEGNG